MPTPTFPVFNTTKCVDVALAVEDAISKRRRFVSPLFADRENFAQGVVVPMPMLPLPPMTNLSVVPSAVDDAMAKRPLAIS